MKNHRKQFRNVCIAVVAILFLSGLSTLVFSHCQIPCGIYDDPMRFEMMAENIKTIEKSMQQIQELQKNADQNSNQLVRWIMNKEDHADQLSEVVTDYFLKQRIKPVWDEQSAEYPQYTRQLVLLHKMMIYSMKCKQTTELENISILRESLDQFRKIYFGEDTPISEQHEHK